MANQPRRRDNFPSAWELAMISELPEFASIMDSLPPPDIWAAGISEQWKRMMMRGGHKHHRERLDRLNIINMQSARHAAAAEAQAGPQGPQASTVNAVNATIKMLELQQRGEVVKDAKNLNKEMKRLNKHSDRRGYRCPCVDCHTKRVNGASGLVPDITTLEPIMELLQGACKKRGFTISKPYAVEFLLANDKKLVPALSAIIADLTARELALVATGRINFGRESKMAESIKCETLDEIIAFIEDDDFQIRDFEANKWNSSYGQSVIKNNPHRKQHWYDLYLEESRYRNDRAMYYRSKKADVEAGRLPAADFDQAIAAYRFTDSQKPRTSTMVPIAKNPAFAALKEAVNKPESSLDRDNIINAFYTFMANDTVRLSKKEEPTMIIEDNDTVEYGGEILIRTKRIGDNIRVLRKHHVFAPESSRDGGRASKAEAAQSDKQADLSKLQVESNKHKETQTDTAPTDVEAATEHRREVEKEAMRRIHNYLGDAGVQAVIDSKKAEGAYDELDDAALGAWIEESGDTETVAKLRACGPNEAKRHCRLIKLHDDITGSMFEDNPLDMAGVNHLLECCPWTNTVERAHAEICVASGSAVLAVAFSQAREKELDRMYRKGRPTYSDEEAARFVAAIRYKITPGEK